MKRVLFSSFIIVFLSIVLSFTSFAKDIQNGYFFYSNTCLDCKDLEENYNINEFLEKNNLIRLNARNNEDISILKNELSRLNSNTKIKTPILIYNDEVFAGKQAIQEFLIKETNLKPSPIILFLGFLDGLNPCAISILMIFSSFLITLDKKKQLLIVGINFIIGEVLSNLLLGFGIFEITLFANNFEIFSKLVFIFTLVVCGYVIFINFIDIYNGLMKKEEIKNMLSLNIRYRINNILSKKMTSNLLFLFAFGIGFIIGIMEFGCTGQVYLPSILYMHNSGINMILGLISYNLMFALPLIIFLIIALFINPTNVKTNVMKYSFIIKIVVNIVLIVLFTQILLRLIF